MTLDGDRAFSNTGDNTVVVEGLRSVADIDKAGGNQMSRVTVKIYGMALEAMNKLTMLSWLPMSINKNTLQIDAIEGDVVTRVFDGTIANAWPDLQAEPDVCLHVEAQAGLHDQVKPVPPTTYKGDVDVVELLEDLTGKVDCTLENNGVEGVFLTNPYLPNTYMEQIKAVVEAANIDWFFDPPVLAICPKGMPRAGEAPLISPETGMVGYPVWDNTGITFKTLFNPAIVFGGSVKIESMVTQAAGEKVVQMVKHNLSSQVSGGPWFTTIKCTESGLVVI